MFRRAWKHAVQPLRQQLLQLTETVAAESQPASSHGGFRLGSANARRQLFSSAESGQGGGGGSAPKSMLDATLPHNGAAGTALSGTAAARLRAVAAAEGAGEGAADAAAGVAPQAGRTGRRILGRMFDFALYTSLAAVAAGGYVYSQYSIAEVQEALAKAEQQQQQEPSLQNQAWVQLLQLYLSVALPVDEKVRSGQVRPCQHKRCRCVSDCVPVRQIGSLDV